MRHLIFILLLTACGPKGDGRKSPVPPFSYSMPIDLQEKAMSYRNLVGSVQDEWGFVGTERCDSLLMTALAGASGVAIKDIHAAEDPANPGKWVRRPEFRPDAPEACFPNNSGSSISRDQLLGLAWYAWRTRDLGIVQAVTSYADTHGGQMGEGDEYRIGIRKPLYDTFRLLEHKLGGREPGEWLPLFEFTAQKGFAAHLQVLHIVLRAEIDGHDMPLIQRQVLKQLAERSPNSPVMQAAAARWYSSKYWDRFLDAARNEQYWPHNRLPTSADRCIDWATQEQNPADWTPCPEEGRIHSGGDLLFAISIIQRDAP